MKPLLAPTLREVLTEAGATPEELEAASQALLESRSDALPWYVRAATGFGAWSAAGLVLGFLGLTGLFASKGIALVLGAVLLACAVPLSGRGNEFTRQLAIVLGLAGQGLTLASLGLMEMSPTPLALVAAAQAGALFVLHRDPAHRFLCAGGTIAALLVAAAFQEASVAAEMLVVLVMAGVVAAGRIPSGALSDKTFALVAPGRFGVLLVCLGALCLTFERRLTDNWLTVHLGLGLTAVLGAIVFLELRARKAAVSRALTLLPVIALVGYLSLSAPGVVAALIVLAVALRERDAVLLLVGVAFLLAFLSGFYSQLDLPLWHKAGLLMGSGLAALGVRALLRRFIPESDAAVPSGAPT